MSCEAVSFVCVIIHIAVLFIPILLVRASFFSEVLCRAATRPQRLWAGVHGGCAQDAQLAVHEGGAHRVIEVGARAVAHAPPPQRHAE